MWHLPLRAICRTLCRAGPACPAGSNAYRAAGHMGPALRIIPRPLRCRASPTGGRRGGRPCPPAGDGALDVPAGRCGISPYGRFAAPLCRAGPACPAGINVARRDTWVPPYESYCAPFGAEYHRQADVGADDPVRPQGTAPLMSRRGDVASPPTGDLPHPSVGRGPRAPPGSMHIARRDT